MKPVKLTKRIEAYGQRFNAGTVVRVIEGREYACEVEFVCQGGPVVGTVLRCDLGETKQ